MDTSESESEDFDHERDGLSNATTHIGMLNTVGEAYCRDQGAFMFNLIKLLNEASTTHVDMCVRWHPKIQNALQVNWSVFEQIYDTLHPVLVRYKITRNNNSKRCARASWNRKLREWDFEMVALGLEWTTYIHSDPNFNRFSTGEGIRTCRR
tara:strand:- start:11318 stop:11773 length:456 start_codon:yes stop_codon:yes gene_type:complete